MNIERITPREVAGAAVARGGHILASVLLSGRYGVECVAPEDSHLERFISLRDRRAAILVDRDWRPSALRLLEQIERDMAAIPLHRKWSDHIRNLVTTEGKNALLTHALKASALTQTVVMGLVESTGYSSFNATNTAANITAVGGGSPTNGWNEATTSQCAARGSPSFGTASAGSLATSSAVAFSMLATATMKGAFLMMKSTAGTAPTTTTGNTNGALYSCGAFSGGDRAVINGDTVNVTYTASA